MTGGADYAVAVTLVAAMRCSDRMILAADGIGMSLPGGVVTQVEKLYISEGHALAWGFAGDEGPGFAFRRSIERAAIPQNWDAFSALARDLIAQANRARIDAGRSVSQEPKPAQLATALFVGYLGGQPGILKLEWNGNVLFDDESSFVLIGEIGHAQAHGALEAIRRLLGSDFEYNETNMTAVMEATVATSLGLGRPISYVTVTASGASRRTDPPSR